MIKNVLIVEDDTYKEQQIVNYLKSKNNSIMITRNHSINSALRNVYKNNYDLIILDMSLPTFDTNEPEHFQPYGGLIFLDELKRLKSSIPVVILTQYARFGEGDTEISIETIDETCRKKYQNYKEILYFLNSDWENKIIKYIKGE